MNPTPPQRIAITGASGLIGSALSRRLEQAGHTVLPVTRSPGSDREIAWSPSGETIESVKLEGVDAVVHLAGESILGRWTDAKKRRIRDSRVRGTALIARALADLDDKPRALIVGSAIGYYGDRGDTVLDETDTPGDNFLAKVCVDWEAAAGPAQQAGLRVACARTGVVLTPDGGALAQMLPIFRLGLGGTIGPGSQWWSWITLDDEVRALEHLIFNDTVTGPANLVAPVNGCVTARDFTNALGDILRRPTLFPVPSFAAKIALGQFAEEALIASQRVAPAALEQSGFVFNHTQLEPALRSVLDR